MGIVKISEQLHQDLRKVSLVMDRSINAQAAHWLKIGQIIEAHPNMCYQDVVQYLLKKAHTENNALSMALVVDDQDS
ncbi:ParD-like family protein [Marinicella sp. W31]|uniref:ParD-like family protein n=1 Tax=Marinicella sp. W31 TaxID=3023713 RepID=UPI003757F154